MQLYAHLVEDYLEGHSVLTDNTTNQNWEQIFDVIQKSFPVQKHVDFFKWLQGSVSKILPHDVLVAAWGDFSSGEPRRHSWPSTSGGCSGRRS